MEILELLAEEDPRATMRQMKAAGELAKRLPACQDLLRFEALVEIETGQLFEWDAELRLAALLPDDRAATAETAAHLGLSDPQKARLSGAVTDASLRIVSWMSPREIRRAIYRIGGQAFRDRALLAWAASGRPVTTPQWRMLAVYPNTWTPPGFPLTDAEILAAGVPTGPLVAAVKHEVEEWWLDLDFTDDKMAVIERLKAVAQGLAY
jgi:poly(A) polymerase